MNKHIQQKFEGQQVHYRHATIERAENDTYYASLSSETPVWRGDYQEILVHTPEAVNLERASKGIALLFDHDHTGQIGRVKDVRIDSARLVGNLTFGNGERAREARQDVAEGLRQEISIGYTIDEFEERGNTIWVTRWTLLEVSLVSIPADPSVGVGRSTVIPNTRMHTMSTETRSSVENTGTKHEHSEVSQLLERVRELEKQEMKRDLGWLPEDAAKKPKPAAAGGELRNELIGNSGIPYEDLSQFSIARAIFAEAFPNDRDAQLAGGMSLEMSREAAKRHGVAPKGIYVPPEVLAPSYGRRDLVAGTATDGAELVGTDHLAGSFIGSLRNSMTATAAGAEMLTGLAGDVDIPKLTSDANAGWIVGEDTAASESDPQFASVTLSPKMLGAWTDISRQLRLQATPAVEAIVQDSLAYALGNAIDNSIFYGSGSAGEPQGISTGTDVNIAGAGLTAFAAADPTYAELVAMIAAVASDNALVGRSAPVFVLSIETAMNLAATVLDSGSGRFIFEPGESLSPNLISGKIGAFNAIASAQITSGDVFYGSFSNALIGQWGGLDITVDPYTNSTKGKVRIVALQNVDVAIRHGQAFAFNNDGV